MTAAITDAIGAMLDHYSDVIEGGNSYNSGSSYRGIPGTQSTYRWIVDDGTLAATSNGTSTTIVSTEPGDSVAFDLARVHGPPFFARCVTATNSANVGAARKITAYTPSTFTVAAFPAATTSADTFAIMEGFRRAPDKFDINDPDENVNTKYDRNFTLEALPGSPMGYYGNGISVYETELVLSLRMLRYGRSRHLRATLVENLSLLGTLMIKGASPDHRDGTYVRALYLGEEGPEVELEDEHKAVAVLKMPLIYRVNTEML